MALKYNRISSIEDLGVGDTYDISNFSEDKIDGQGNFLINGLVVHNCIPEAVENRDDKHQLWRKKIHPKILPIVEDTYGVLIFQEQLQQMFQLIAGFTAPEAQEVRKAVAKKWKHLLKPIEAKWMQKASEEIGELAAEEWWSKLVTFGRYAFNRCLDKDTLLKDEVTGISKTVEQWHQSEDKPTLWSYNGNDLVLDECVAIHDNGDQEVYQITFDDGSMETVTAGHKFLCDDGEYHEAKEIFDQGLEITRFDASERG